MRSRPSWHIGPVGWRPSTRRLVGIAAALTVAGLLLWGFLAGRREAGAEAEREAPVKAASRATVQNGQVVVVVPLTAQARGGIVVAPAQPGIGAPVRGYGTVLELDSLAALHNDYAAALSQVEQAKAHLGASRREYERLEGLHRDDQNISAKALEAARAAMLADQAGAQSAAAPLRTLEATAREDWGPVVGAWATRGSPEFSRLLARQDVLVQVTVPPDVVLAAAPPVVALEAAAGRSMAARFVSASARTDPRIQGMSFFYLAPFSATMLPGMNVVATLGTAGRAGSGSGVVIPESAVTWAQGRAWVYVRTAPTAFVRRRVPTDTPAAGGGYLAGDIGAGTAIVVQGAQMLLSAEFANQVPVGEGDER